MTHIHRITVRPRIALFIVILVFGAITAQGQTNVFNLADFDPIGDGVGDDGPALQRALDAVAAAGGGTLLIPAGVYKIKTSVVKDFAGASLIIQGVPSDTMPAPPTADGDQLARSLDLDSEFIPATGENHHAITLNNVDNLTIEHIAFTGTATSFTDAYITLFLNDINHATIRHCEFYGISTFGSIFGQHGGNIIRAVRSELSVESSSFLGCTSDSGTYAPIIDNHHWKKFSIANSIFIDYGLRSFFGKMGLGAPLSWINFATVAPRTPESSRREAVIRDTFFDEGGWVGITAYPHKWGDIVDPIDLIYISGIKINVSNMATSGHHFFDVRNALIENSHYGWSKNAYAAIDVFRSNHVILDRLTCIAHADRLRADRTERFTVINSLYTGIDSTAVTTTEMQTAPEDDPVQYVRQRFLAVSGKQPTPAAHFYWSDLLIRCGSDNACLNQQREALTEYLGSSPQQDFAMQGKVVDEKGNPIEGVTIALTGSQSLVALTDELGQFRFANLPTSGTYTVTSSKRHYKIENASKTFAAPSGNVEMLFKGVLDRYTISGQVRTVNSHSVAGVTINLVHSQTLSTTTDADGFYSFANLPAGENYALTPLPKDSFLMVPVNLTINDLSTNVTLNISARLQPELLTLQNSDVAIVFDSVSFVSQPLPIFPPFDVSEDGLARVMVFVKNIEYVFNTSQVVVTAEDSEQKIHTLPVEFERNVTLGAWVKQINFRLSPNLGHGRCVKLRVSVDGLQSNAGRVCFAPEARSDP